MRISKVGGVIAAASQSVAQPLLQIGTIPIIRRIVISYQRAGIFPIVVVTGAAERPLPSPACPLPVCLRKRTAESSKLPPLSARLLTPYCVIRTTAQRANARCERA